VTILQICHSQQHDTVLQAMVLLAVEKMTVCFPRMSQKLERFYKAVVEEALLGKYPDVAEDFTSGKLLLLILLDFSPTGLFSTDKILRERQRQEICGALRGSNLYYNMFMMKNVLEVLLAFVFISMNVIVGVQSKDTTELCEIQMLDRKTVVVMQCRQKRYDVFIALLQLFTFTLVLHALVNLCSVCWGLPRYCSIWYLCPEILSPASGSGRSLASCASCTRRSRPRGRPRPARSETKRRKTSPSRMTMTSSTAC
jgi:hypothetical protein